MGVKRTKLIRMWHDRTLVGKTVICQRQKRQVLLIYQDVEGGVRLDKPVEGLVSWNVGSLRLA